MSGLLMGMAFYAVPNMSEKMTLLALCDHANDQGEQVFTGLDVLAQKVGADRRTIQRNLRKLEDASLIITQLGVGRGRMSGYQIDLDTLITAARKGGMLSGFPRRKGGNGDQEKAAADAGKGGTASSHLVSKKQPESKATNNQNLTTLSGAPDPLPRKAILRDPAQQRQAALETIEFLNHRTGHRYKPVEAIIRLIVARFSEGATITQVRSVIGTKTDEWKDDPKMAKYLRPKTLFAASNFADYSGQLPALALQVEA